MEVWRSAAIGFDHANGTAVVFGDGGQLMSWVRMKMWASSPSDALRRLSRMGASLRSAGPNGNRSKRDNPQSIN
jgi:hypothetical protein